MLGPVLYLFLYHNSRRVCNIARIIMSMQHSLLADDNRVPLGTRILSQEAAQDLMIHRQVRQLTGQRGQRVKRRSGI